MQKKNHIHMYYIVYILSTFISHLFKFTYWSTVTAEGVRHVTYENELFIANVIHIHM